MSAWLGDYQWITGPAMVVLMMLGLPAYNRWRERGLEQEFKRNDAIEAPTAEQLKWHLRHTREDINLMCHLMFFILFVEVLRLFC